jgi:hypothetical protein
MSPKFWKGKAHCAKCCEIPHVIHMGDIFFNGFCPVIDARTDGKSTG